jgi:hypothetical protein
LIAKEILLKTLTFVVLAAALLLTGCAGMPIGYPGTYPVYTPNAPAAYPTFEQYLYATCSAEPWRPGCDRIVPQVVVPYNRTVAPAIQPQAAYPVYQPNAQPVRTTAAARVQNSVTPKTATVRKTAAKTKARK